MTEGDSLPREVPKRLAPLADTLRRLYLMSRNQCAFPGCPSPIVDGDGTYVAQVCHLRAAEPGGQRFDPEQTNEERRAFENLMLMCYEHHQVTNDEVRYPVERMQRIKAEHEMRAETGLRQMFEARETSVVIHGGAQVSLGGSGGAAPGAGGGGGAAIGRGAQGGRGGPGGDVTIVGEDTMQGLVLAPEGRVPGSGGGGAAAIGDGARGGDGGGGGDVHEAPAQLKVGEYKIEIGRGAPAQHLPGQHGAPGGATRMTGPDGAVFEVKGGTGARSADSYLPEGVRELGEADLEAGVSCVVLSPADRVDVTAGNLLNVTGLGWGHFIVSQVPVDRVWSVAGVLQLPQQCEPFGFYLALYDPSGSERACRAIGPISGHRTIHFQCLIGATFDAIGTWRLVAHSGGFELAQYEVDVRAPER